MKETLWEVFCETGDIGVYLEYKKVREDDERNRQDTSDCRTGGQCE